MLNWDTVFLYGHVTKGKLKLFFLSNCKMGIGSIMRDI